MSATVSIGHSDMTFEVSKSSSKRVCVFGLIGTYPSLIIQIPPDQARKLAADLVEAAEPDIHLTPGCWRMREMMNKNRVKTNYMKRTDEMYLVYQDEAGSHHYQYWADVQEVGTLIDPETGDDMELVGWAIPDREE